MAEENKTQYSPNKEEIDKHKVNAVLSYLGILIIVPLLNEEVKKSPYALHHLNQGLILTIIGFVVGAVVWVPLIGWAAGIVVFVLWVMGIMSAVNGDMKKLPLIGEYTLIK